VCLYASLSISVNYGGCLIVEDTEVQARLIVNFITDQHTVVGWAQTQQKAVSLTQSKNPEIAIIDLNLHDGDGITTTEVINSYDETISIIVSTVSVSKRNQTARTGRWRG